MGFAAFGHVRLVTNGTQLNEVKKQGFLPVITDRVMKLDNESLHEAEFGVVMLAKK